MSARLMVFLPKIFKHEKQGQVFSLCCVAHLWGTKTLAMIKTKLCECSSVRPPVKKLKKKIEMCLETFSRDINTWSTLTITQLTPNYILHQNVHPYGSCHIFLWIAWYTQKLLFLAGFNAHGVSPVSARLVFLPAMGLIRVNGSIFFLLLYSVQSSVVLTWLSLKWSKP